MCLLDTSITPSKHINAKTQHLHLQWTQGAGNVWMLLIHVKHASHNTGVCLHIGKTHLCVSIFQCQGKMVVSNTGPPSIYLNSQNTTLLWYSTDEILLGCVAMWLQGCFGFLLIPPMYIHVSKKPRCVIQVNMFQIRKERKLKSFR